MMYHYFKWAALSLFFKRNLRYLLLMLFSFIGIYAADALYRDFVDYFIATGRKEQILVLMAVKWAVVICLSLLLAFSIMQLGFGRKRNVSKIRAMKGGSKKAGRRKDRKKMAGEEKRSEERDDPMMERLEVFRGKKRLKRKSDLLMERMKKEAES